MEWFAQSLPYSWGTWSEDITQFLSLLQTLGPPYRNCCSKDLIIGEGLRNYVLNLTSRNKQKAGEAQAMTEGQVIV